MNKYTFNGPVFAGTIGNDAKSTPSEGSRNISIKMKDGDDQMSTRIVNLEADGSHIEVSPLGGVYVVIPYEQNIVSIPENCKRELICSFDSLIGIERV